MSDSQTISPQNFVDQFRQALLVRETIDKRELSALIQQYARLCDEANRRLHECHQLIQRGQYSNAVALAEQEPGLLAHCGLLDVPERDLLAAAAQELGIKPPGPINYDVAEAIQVAYEKASTVGANLKRLHTLTLARAPLPTRLAVMRQLLVQNPNHPHMDADIRTFEKAWFRQAPQFAATWARKGRWDVVAEMLSDLAESGYLETPPAALLAMLQSQLAKARQAALPQLAAEIRRQFEQRSLSGLEPLVRQWAEWVPGPAAAELAQRHGVAAALAWARQVREENALGEQRRKARARLENLLERPGATCAELQAAYTALERVAEVDGDLERRFHRRLAQLGRRRALLISSGLAGAVLLCAVLGYVGNRLLAASRQAAQVRNFMAEVVPLVDGDKYEEAVGKIQAAPPAVAAHPDVAALLTAAKDKAAAVQAFEAAWRDIETRPDDADPLPLVRKARQLACNDTLRRRVQEFEAAWQKKQAVAVERQKAEFERRVAGVLAAVEQLVETSRSGQKPAASATRLAAIDKDLAALRDEAIRSAYDQRPLDEIKGLMAKVDHWGKFAQAFTELRSELKGAKGDVHTLERIAGWLHDTLAPMSPDDALAEQARQAPLSLVNWKHAVELCDSLQSASAARALDDALEHAWKDRPPADVLRAASQYADMYRQRNADVSDTAATELQRYLERPDVANLWAIRRQGETTEYYARVQPKATTNRQEIDVLVSSSGETARLVFSGTLTTRRAPQSEYAERATRFLQAPEKTADWHGELARQCDWLLQAEPIDPLLKFRLLRKTLNLALQGSAGFGQALGAHSEIKSILDPRSLLSEGDWVTGSEARRQRADQLLKAAPRLSQVVKQAVEYDNQLLGQIKRGLAVVGWLAREDGQVVLVPFVGAEPAAGSRLYAVVRDAWSEIGTVERGGPQLNADAGRYAGWPVFAVSKFTLSNP